ncbi:MAG: hypothetical protein HQK50_12800 [Oligoflexia bacterium]|nr:hypothetical protein [Oligoflexia bacterium]MBF0366443.1 hypothetical protein [Oligoflexia bacterium]
MHFLNSKLSLIFFLFLLSVALFTPPIYAQNDNVSASESENLNENDDNPQNKEYRDKDYKDKEYKEYEDNAGATELSENAAGGAHAPASVAATPAAETDAAAATTTSAPEVAETATPAPANSPTPLDGFANPFSTLDENKILSELSKKSTEIPFLGAILYFDKVARICIRILRDNKVLPEVIKTYQNKEIFPKFRNIAVGGGLFFFLLGLLVARQGSIWSRLSKKLMVSLIMIVFEIGVFCVFFPIPAERIENIVKTTLMEPAKKS